MSIWTTVPPKALGSGEVQGRYAPREAPMTEIGVDFLFGLAILGGWVGVLSLLVWWFF